jgi:hypothetical protein
MNVQARSDIRWWHAFIESWNGVSIGTRTTLSFQEISHERQACKELRAALSKAHLDPDLYTGHSFRIGAATVAHAQGIDDSMIMTLGRWSRKSNAYQRYIKIPQQ